MKGRVTACVTYLILSARCIGLLGGDEAANHVFNAAMAAPVC